MKKIINIDAVSDYNELVGAQTLHPLISVIDFSKTNKLLPGDQALNYGLYCIYFKTEKTCALRYGRNTYDYQAGTLVFFAPGQVISMADDDQPYQPAGYALLFHPDLLRGTSLNQHITDYSFFSYDVHEALHLSDLEKKTVFDCFHKIEHELGHAIDKHSRRLIVSNLELFLNYCVRFYDRQFITRDHAYAGVVEKFERLLNAYFSSDKPQLNGIPTVAFFSRELHLSANYFGDLIKKETGKTAQDYIHAKLIEVAKEKIVNPTKTVSEVGYEVGFKYPQHFTRFFKQKVGISPKEYSHLN